MLLVRIARGIALLTTGLLAGAFSYGAVNVAPTFRAVPLDVRLTFHIALMKMNAVVMQAGMALALISAIALIVVVRAAVPRLLAAGASALLLATFLVTRFGNVPINRQMREWVADAPPADYADILQVWDTFHIIRTATAIAAFLLIIAIADRARTLAADARDQAVPAAVR
ncbi:uncharacterized protein DUF1772 [Murinocardiopsis flavida]|uniref:Uncharacterized protein DUF1772 n=1 Tax=Murinocardiopsis flavida TaxID=645275 RepID=A0A2P8CJ71_9ACTN|nr:DUF1772 domain-containing protein [Murinocardiopsis flavida]PSK85011.1 uncharacterized protein DUF1772 [Murinocardiopsis flavida]